MVAEVGATALSPREFPVSAVVNFLVTIPFLGILIGGGYWLSRSDIQADRYPRIAAWTAAGFVSLAGSFAIIAWSTSESPLVRIGIVRWAGAAGAGAGALVAIFDESS